MKKFMMALAFAGIAMVSFAQEAVTSEVVVPTLKKSVITNGFWSNWFISANGGYQLFNGVTTNGESMFDHGTAAISAYVGKWHTPGYGWRIAYNGYEAKALKDADKFSFYNVHADAMFNLSNLFCGYNEKRIWNVIPYVGVGWAGREAMNHEDFDGLSGSITANYGLINSFRVSKHWAINLELAGTFLRNGFSGVEGSSGHDMMWSANLGVTYKFNKVDWEQTVDLPALNAMHAAALAELMSQLNDAQAENNKLKNAYKALKNDYDKLNVAYNELKNKPAVDVKESIFFAFGSSKIASKKEQLNIEAYAKAAAEAGAKLRVIGYTDTIGSEEYNKGLAEARANAVAEVLKAAGVEVEVVAVGESSEHATKYLNRRAVIEIAR